MNKINFEEKIKGYYPNLDKIKYEELIKFINECLLTDETIKVI